MISSNSLSTKNLIENNKKFDTKWGNKFSVLPSIEKVFAETKFVSSNLLKIFYLERHGRFHQLIKGSKRIIREEDALKEQKSRELAELISRQAEEIEQMKDEMVEYKVRVEDYERDSDILKRLYEDDFIDQDGNPVNRDDK